MTKDLSVQQLITELRDSLGSDAFQVVDHWEVDATAIGFAKPEDPSTLVYVSTFGQAAGRYYVELEIPSSKADFRFMHAASYDGVDLPQLVTIVRRHLALAS